MGKKTRKRSVVPAAPSVPIPIRGWQAVVMFAGNLVQSGSDHTTETAARHAAKLAGDGLVFIMRPDGTRYRYFKQPGE